MIASMRVAGILFQRMTGKCSAALFAAASMPLEFSTPVGIGRTHLLPDL